MVVVVIVVVVKVKTTMTTIPWRRKRTITIRLTHYRDGITLSGKWVWVTNRQPLCSQGRTGRVLVSVSIASDISLGLKVRKCRLYLLPPPSPLPPQPLSSSSILNPLHSHINPFLPPLNPLSSLNPFPPLLNRFPHHPLPNHLPLTPIDTPSTPKERYIIIAYNSHRPSLYISTCRSSV